MRHYPGASTPKQILRHVDIMREGFDLGGQQIPYLPARVRACPCQLFFSIRIVHMVCPEPAHLPGNYETRRMCALTALGIQSIILVVVLVCFIAGRTCPS